jgi:hypothetical protein
VFALKLNLTNSYKRFNLCLPAEIKLFEYAFFKATNSFIVDVLV